jgi:hypothetical protein
MKNSIIISAVFVACALICGSCGDDDSEGVSRITYFPVITLNGDEELFIETGEPYTEPGAVSKEGETEIETNISYTGTYFGGAVGSIDTSVPDRYDVTYAATNKDGFPGTATRTVYVAGQGDLVNSIEGLYTATISRNGAAPGTQYSNLKYVIIAKTGANTYSLSDGIGGYYDLGRAYGAGYAASGTEITANNIAANDFSYGPHFGVGAFGGDASITSFSVDAGTKTIHFITEWDAGPYTFDITLKQVSF